MIRDVFRCSTLAFGTHLQPEGGGVPNVASHARAEPRGVEPVLHHDHPTVSVALSWGIPVPPLVLRRGGPVRAPPHVRLVMKEALGVAASAPVPEHGRQAYMTSLTTVTGVTLSPREPRRASLAAFAVQGSGFDVPSLAGVGGWRLGRVVKTWCRLGSRARSVRSPVCGRSVPTMRVRGRCRPYFAYARTDVGANWKGQFGHCRTQRHLHCVLYPFRAERVRRDLSG